MTEVARRGPALAQRVLDATLSLLGEVGYGFSIDELATRVGVHKTTVYRHWPTKATLVAAAMDRFAAATVPFPDSGRPVDDLGALAGLVAASLRDPVGRRLLLALMAAAAENPEVVDVAQRFLASRYAGAVALIDAAQSTGELRDDVDPSLVWRAFANPLHIASLLGEPLDDDAALVLWELVLSGARPRTS